MVKLEIKPTAEMRLRVAGLFWVSVGLAALEMFLLSGGGADFFARHTTLTTYMPDAAGLDTDSEVRLGGLNIGSVSDVELSGSPDRRRAVRIEMRILSRYLRYIPTDSQLDINADTIVAEKFISISQGKSSVPVAENGVLALAPTAEETNRAELIESLQKDLAQVDQILTQMESPQTEIGRFITGEAEYDRALAHISGFDSALHTFLNPQSSLGQAVYSPALYNQIHDVVTNVDKTLASIQNGEGAFGHLFASDDQYNQFLAQLRDLRGSLAQAAANPMLRDDALYGRIARLLASTDGAIASLNAGEGTVGRLLTNAQMYESMNGSLRKMEALLQDFREHTQKYLRIRHKIF